MNVLVPILAALGILLSLLLIWGLLEPHTFRNEDHLAVVPNLPESWEGKRLGLIADLHVGMFLDNRRTAHRIVQALVDKRPDLVLIAGDFVHDTSRAIGPAVDLVRRLPEAGIPTYAVLGNHDYAMPTKTASKNQQIADELKLALESAGVRVLCNEAVPLPRPGADGEAPLYLVGIGAHTPGYDKPADAVASLPPRAARIVMMHHPASFDGLPPETAPFAIAAHTHGGQVRLPSGPIWSYFSYIKDIKVYIGGWIVSGLIDGYGAEGNHLYVTRGIGCSVVPLRIACPPEMTMFTLKRLT